MSTEEGDKLHVVTADDISNNKKRLGKFLVWGSAIILAFTLLIQALDTNSYLTIDLETWRPSLYAYVFWAFCLCVSQVLTRGGMENEFYSYCRRSSSFLWWYSHFYLD